MEKHSQIDQAILMRDIIGMYRDYSNDSDAVEYLSSFVFTISNIVQDNNLDDQRLDWNLLFGFLDKRYHGLKYNLDSEIDEVKMNDLYVKAKGIIEDNLPK